MSERSGLNVIEISVDEAARAVQPALGGQRAVAVALGNFDGVHLGHQRVIEAARAAALREGIALGVATFRPHPRQFFQPQAESFRLQSDLEKDRALSACGVSHRYAISFTRAVSEMTPDEFVRRVLVEAIGVAHVAIGADFCFGHQRSGNSGRLVELGCDYGFTTDAIALAAAGGVRYASSAAREALKAGDPQAAAAILSRPFILDGRVERGEQRGRTIGFPTANLSLGALIAPRLGVYAVRMQVEGQSDWMDGVANIGIRPTFEGVEPQLEVHLFDRAIDLYGRYVRVAVLDFLRDEQKFSGIDALKEQISRDDEVARQRLATIPEPRNAD
jgi:riboflavin kinase / FMN adenylyltransferase